MWFNFPRADYLRYLDDLNQSAARSSCHRHILERAFQGERG